MFHILLAEDDANLRHVVEKTLRSAGYTVAGAEDGRAAWDMICHERFDLVITDVMMPCMDGNALTAAVRRQSRDTPVLMLTALEAIDDKEKGFTSGADDYLVKPFVLRELLLRVKALLRWYQAVSESRIVLPHTELDDQTSIARSNGAGISEEDRQHIFTPFYAGNRFRNREGSGLGLSLSRTIVDKLGGAITFESAEGVGSTFTVRLPCEIGAGDTTGA